MQRKAESSVYNFILNTLDMLEYQSVYSCCAIIWYLFMARVYKLFSFKIIQIREIQIKMANYKSIVLCQETLYIWKPDSFLNPVNNSTVYDVLQ